VIPYSKYPGLSPLFHDFLAGLPEFYPDPPTLDAAAQRGKEILAAGGRSRVPASAFRHRGGKAVRMAEDLAAGRAVAVSTGQQVGVFTGPAFTLMKALDTIRIAGELSKRGVPAVPVFWALTDDHDLQEIARVAFPTHEGPKELVLEGADRQNRRPVGTLPIPERVREAVEAMRADKLHIHPDAERILDAFAARSAPGTTYGEAFIETLLDIVEPDPLLVLDPLAPEARPATVEFFLALAGKAGELKTTLRETVSRLERAGKPIPAPLPEGFSFFVIDEEGRRRVTDLAEAVERVRSGKAFPSGDVITRPVLKSYLIPMAASILGAAEIAYHAQSLPIFGLMGIPRPVLIPRTHVIVRGPAERRLAAQLEIPEEDLLQPPAAPAHVAVPQADAVTRLAETTSKELAALGPELESLDLTLSGALENATKKIVYQFEQLAERARKAAERKGDVTTNRRKRLSASLLPSLDSIPAERVYSPLSAMLAFGRDDVLAGFRSVAGTGASGAAIVDFGVTEDEEKTKRAGDHAR
jgi:bacillithiol biosynthesis cysteine-adding enzyme BshC